MADYMKLQDYIWDNNKVNYIRAGKELEPLKKEVENTGDIL